MWASAPEITSNPANDSTLHGERGVWDDGTIFEEKWVPFKPNDTHEISISITATGYGEVAFVLNGERMDYDIGHWVSEPIEKAVEERFVFKITESNNVDVANIQPTTVNVSGTGSASTRSVSLVTYGSKSEMKGAQASNTGVGINWVEGETSFWKWDYGITTPVPAEPYNGSYSITTNDYMPPLAYSLRCPSYVLKGEDFEARFEINRSYEWIKWYYKSPSETGLGTLGLPTTLVPKDYPKILDCPFVMSSGTIWGEYVITAVAKVASTGEEVSDSCSFTLVEEGIFFNKDTFIEGKNETLDIMVICKDLYLAQLYIGGNLVHDTTYANGTHVVYLDEVIGSSYSVGNHSLMISGYKGQNMFTHDDSITVIASPGYSENSTSLSAYGTYEAEVVESNPIKEVKWSIKKPGGEWKEVKRDKVNGGYSSSLSYSLDSTTGTYEVKAEVHFYTNGSTHTSSFTVQ